MARTRREQRPAAHGGHDERRGERVPRWLQFVLPLAVLGITLLAFLPALGNGFVTWDDDKNLLQNDHFRGLGWPQLRWMLTAYWIGHYHPLTWLSFAVDYCIWGLGERGAFGFHLTNVVVHALNAVLLYFLARRLLAIAMPSAEQKGWLLYAAAAFAALLFAVHPLRVESVAWVTERRDVLSTFFLLACVLAYVRYAAHTPGRWRWYAGAVVLLLASLLCKAWGMTLPAVLLVLDWYPLHRFRRGPRLLPLILEKLPFVTLAGWAAYHAVQAQGSALYTLKTLGEYGWLPRVAQAFYGVTFYLWKTLLPTGLAPIYEIPVRMNPFEPRFIVAASVAIAITVLVVAARRRWPSGLALWALYLIIVAPVLGLTQAGPQLVADRYSYIACMTWTLLAGAGLLHVAHRRFAPFAAVAVGVVAVFTVLTWQQTKVWRTSGTLWAHALAVAPNSYNAHTNLAAELQRRGEYDSAERHYRAALAVNPDGYEALGGFGGLLVERGQYDEALTHLRHGLERNPHEASIFTNLAILLQRLGRHEEAVALYRERLALSPPAVQQATLYSGLGGALGSLGRFDEAIACFRRAIALAPDDDLPHFNLGLALQRTGHTDGALEELRIAIRLGRELVNANPKLLSRTHYLDALLLAGELYAARGDRMEASEHLQRARELAPNDARIHELLRRLERP